MKIQIFYYFSAISKDQKSIPSKITYSAINYYLKENISASIYRQQLKDSYLNQRSPTENKVLRLARFEEYKPTSSQNC